MLAPPLSLTSLHPRGKISHTGVTRIAGRTLLAEIGRIRPIIERLKEALGLYSRTCSAAVDIWSRSAAARKTLMEIEHLSGYGDVHPNLKRLLAENVPLLLEGLDRVTAVIGSKRRQP